MIKRLQVSGYRLLQDFSADLGDLTVVIGANATGKSTLLDILQLIAQAAELPLSKVFDWHGGIYSIFSAGGIKGRIGWRLTFSRPTKPPFWAGAPISPNDLLAYEVALEQDFRGQPRVIYETLRSAEPLPGYPEPFKFLESRGEHRQIYDPRQQRFVVFDTAPGKGPPVTQNRVRESQKSDANEQLPQAVEEADLLLLARMRFFFEYPVPSYVRLLLSNWAFYTGFDVGRFSALRTKPSDIRPETLLFYSGENLGTVLHEILTRHAYNESAKEIQEFLQAAYPHFEGINAETAHGAPPKVLVRVRERGLKDRPMELWDLSDGFLRFLCLATALLNPLPPPFIAIDEPEVGLHPKLLPIVADMIKTASERTQVLVTTHSPDLLNRFTVDKVAVLSREDSGAMWHRPGSRQSLRKLLEVVGGDTLADLHRSGELEAMR